MNYEARKGPNTREAFYMRWQRGRCYLCGHQMHREDQNDHRRATIDHVRPRAFGGVMKDMNSALACRSCNNARNHKHPTACQRLFAKLVGDAFNEHAEYLHRLWWAMPRPYHSLLAVIK